MYLNSEKKREIFKTYGKADVDTGSTEGQIALFTYRINYLTGKLKKNKKDFTAQKALLDLVGKRRKLLDYYKAKDVLKYRDLIAKLKIRK